MSVIATVRVPAAEFALGSLLDTDDAVSVEATVSASRDVFPYIWVPEGNTETVLERLERTPSVESVAVIDDVDGYRLLRLEWGADVNGLLAVIRESAAIVIGAVGTADRWTFRLRFPSYEDLSSFYSRCVDEGVAVDLAELQEAVHPASTRQFGLTDAQRELVLTAYEDGYFDIPRRTTLVELGEKLEVSDSAVSQRLRRGLASLIGSTIDVDRPPYDPDVPK